MRQEGLARLSALKLNSNSRDFIVMKYLVHDLSNVIPAYAHGHVLDIGCGNKPYETLFSGKIESYTGCDVVQSDLNKVDVICEAINLKFENEKFDTVFSTQVIEHVEDPFKMLSEAARIMKSGGNIIVSAPFCWELHEEPYDFYRYSKYGLRTMFEKNGLEIIEIKANGGKWAAIFQMNINMIYSTFKKKTFFRRILKGIFINARLTSLINKFGCFLDRKYHDELLTLNYVIVAKKL